ncbi:FeoB small GTPase domain-containing protein [Geminocystis sp. CENA526]|uniref:FeoB small GTPase domain-containing protein n=1 Tax=Geminocystis sp. CENA526 TaxID=1355871 RepID=UPI003D6FA10D
MECHKCTNTSCHSGSGNNWLKSLFNKPFSRSIEQEATAEIALVGMPNVGKSVLFHALTGIYVTVSNYPGTTVEISKGKCQIEDNNFSVIDTPGMYSLLPITEEEKVARDLLLRDSLSLAIHVVEAKNLARMLTLTFQLIEAGLPLLLGINMIDEAERLNIKIDPLSLEDKLGIPVIKMSASTGYGIDQLKRRIVNYVH